MKSDKPLMQLLGDVLTEGADFDGRAQVLARTLRHVQCRRTARFASRVALATFGVFFLSWLPWQLMFTPRIEQPADSLIVRSQPLQPGLVLDSQRKSVKMVATAVRPEVVVVATDVNRPAFVEISDQELVQLLAGRGILLRRERSGPAECLFLDKSPEFTQ